MPYNGELLLGRPRVTYTLHLYNYLLAREALLQASILPWVETLSRILFLLMAKYRGDGREPSQRVQRCRSTLW